MRIVMIAALVAAPLTAVSRPAPAAELPGEGSATLQGGVDERSRGRPSEGLELALRDREAPALRAAAAPVSAAAAAAQEDEPRKKRKSTGDKVLTGAAVILGVGALAVGGLLVAIFVN